MTNHLILSGSWKESLIYAEVRGLRYSRHVVSKDNIGAFDLAVRLPSFSTRPDRFAIESALKNYLSSHPDSAVIDDVDWVIPPPAPVTEGKELEREPKPLLDPVEVANNAVALLADTLGITPEDLIMDIAKDIAADRGLTIGKKPGRKRGSKSIETKTGSTVDRDGNGAVVVNDEPGLVDEAWLEQRRKKGDANARPAAEA